MKDPVGRTLRIVFSARVVTLISTFRPKASDARRLFCTLGSQLRRVFFFEKGTLFPYCFSFPWKRPSDERLKGVEMLARDAKTTEEGNMVVGLQLDSVVAGTGPLTYYQIQPKTQNLDQKCGQIRTRTGDPPQISTMLSGCDNQLHHMPRERAQHLPALNQAAMQVLCPIPWIISCAVHNQSPPTRSSRTPISEFWCM